MALLESRIPFSGLAAPPNPSLERGGSHSHVVRGRFGGYQLSFRMRRNSFRFNPHCVSEPPRSSPEEPAEDKVTGDWDKAWLTRNSKAEGASEDAPRAESSGSSSRSPDGTRLTQWGGAVRGGKYRMGEGADGVLDFWGNGEFLLFAALLVLSLFCVLLNFIPPARL